MFYDSPFCVEYAKSGRSKCHSCQSLIPDGALRMGASTQEGNPDFHPKHWYHYACFFFSAAKDLELNGPEQIGAFEYLKFEDQRRIMKSIAESKEEKKLKSKQGIKRKVDYDIDDDDLDDDLDSEELEELIMNASSDFKSNQVKQDPKDNSNSVTKKQKISDFGSEKLDISNGSKNPTNPIGDFGDLVNFGNQSSPDLSEISEELFQHQSNVLFRNIEQSKRLASIKKIPPDHWIQKIRTLSTDTFQIRYHIADLLTFGFLEACATCGGMLYYKLGSYCCACVDCAYSVEYPERVFPDAELRSDELLDGYFFGRFRGKRECDPVLKKCFEFRVKQAMDFLDSSDAHAQPEDLYLYKHDEPDPTFEVPDCHTLESYNALLFKVNILDNINSYARIQLLEDSEKKKFWVLKGYGRIGSAIRGSKAESFGSKIEAIGKFESFYEQHTKKNDWVMGQFETEQSNLDLDPKIPGIYLPFGNPAKKQLIKAHSTLTKIAHAPSVTFENYAQFAQLWNTFYTYFPQSFGSERPALITNREKIAQKKKIIDQLIQG